MPVFDNENSKLNKRDKQFIKYVLEHGRSPDSEVAKVLGITPQATIKIRTKLEEKGIIKGYKPIIDFKKIGINIFALALVKFLPGAWDHYSDAEISEKLRKHAYIIMAAKYPSSEATHILLYGFRDNKQMDEHFIKVKEKLYKIVEFVKICPFAIENLIKNSEEGVLNFVIDEKEFNSENLFKDNPNLKREKLIL